MPKQSTFTMKSNCMVHERSLPTCLCFEIAKCYLLARLGVRDKEKQLLSLSNSSYRQMFLCLVADTVRESIPQNINLV